MQVELRAGDRVVLGGPDSYIEWLIVTDNPQGFSRPGEVLVAPVVNPQFQSAQLVTVTEPYQPDHVPAHQVNRMARYLGGLFPANIAVASRHVRHKPMSELRQGVYVGSVTPRDLENVRERIKEIRRSSDTPTLDAIRDIVGHEVLESIFAPTRDPKAIYT